jgi:hypothetical protein
LTVDEAAARAARVRRGLGLHGAANLAFAALYAWLGWSVVPGRGAGWNAALGGVVALVAAAGLGLLVVGRRARVLAIAAQVVLLVFGAVVVAGLVASAAYLRGVYGPIGRGLAGASVVAAALVVQLVGILPVVQLRFLLGEARVEEAS